MFLLLVSICIKLPVIVAGTKMDLFLPSSTAGVTDEQVLARSRQQIVSLMQRFRFIRQCIKCSAKNLLRVDEVFLKAQQAVLYPFTPLYDLDVGQLSQECKRAFTRIFRMYDRDYDGLLSHSELDRFQHETFHVPVYERDLTGWKKVVSRNSPHEEVVREGKFTVAGFLAIFDVFISQNRLDVPWKALRKFGYDDSLNLHVPESILFARPDDGVMNRSWKLSSNARSFLTDLFHQFDTDHDGVLSLEDINAIFSIIPNPSLPLWHPLRSAGLFQGCFSLPKMLSSPASSSQETSGDDLTMSQSLSTSGITIVSGESFPTVDMSSTGHSMDSNVVSKPLSFLDWMGLWHAVSAVSPAVTRAELFRLGHIEVQKRKGKRRRSKKKIAAMPSGRTPDSLLSSREARVLLLGSPGSGKTALINALCCIDDPLSTIKRRSPETSSTHVRLKKKITTATKGDLEDSMVVHLVITDVPEAEAENRTQRKKHLSQILSGGNCDLVMLAFDSTNSASLAYAKHLEETLLTDDISRVYIGTKSDQCAPKSDESHLGEEGAKVTQPETVIDEAAAHCKELDLEPPLVTSATSQMLSADGDLGQLNRRVTLERLARSCLYEIGVERLRAKPHEESKRREAARRRNRKMIWFGVGVGVAAAVVGFWTGATSRSKDSNQRNGRLEWFKNLFKRRSLSVKVESDS
jgi:GTPase SAR1 family protein